MPEKVRIALVDDHPLLREGVAGTLSVDPMFEVVGHGENADDAIRLAEELLPDIILLDVSMHGGGIAAARAIAKSCPVVKIVMLTVSEDEDDVTGALKAGARGYILKGVSGPELVRIIRSVVAGDAYITPALAAALLGDLKPASGQAEVSGRLADLTVREREILELVAVALSNKEIAARLNLTEKTVKFYMTNILQKLQVRNRVEAALVARDAGPASE